MTTETMPANQNRDPGEKTHQGSFVYIEKIIEGFPHYAIANNGNLISLTRYVKNGNGLKLVTRKVLAGSVGKDGYKIATISNDTESVTVSHHKLVAEYFLPTKPTDLHVPNHKDGIKVNNHINNLEWMTRKENTEHAIVVLGWKPVGVKGYANPLCKRSPELILEVKRLKAFGIKQIEIAKTTKLSQTIISRILTGVYDA
jgi:hypothetical protein